MIVKTVTFEVRKEARDRFEKKFRDDKASLDNWDTCLGNEIWVQEKDGVDSISFTAVSRWRSRDDFNAWLKRPEHKQHHKDLKADHKFDKDANSPLLLKVAHEYEVLD